MTQREYQKLVDEMSPRSPILKNCIWAFVSGGAICLLGQVLRNLYEGWGLETEQAGTLMSVTLVFLSALFTGLSLYDDLAKHAGAGTLVPITGFANAVCAPAVEFKTDACDIIGPSRKA